MKIMLWYIFAVSLADLLISHIHTGYQKKLSFTHESYSKNIFKKSVCVICPPRSIIKLRKKTAASLVSVILVFCGCLQSISLNSGKCKACSNLEAS